MLAHVGCRVHYNGFIDIWQFTVVDDLVGLHWFVSFYVNTVYTSNR